MFVSVTEMSLTLKSRRRPRRVQSADRACIKHAPDRDTPQEAELTMA